MIKSTTLLQRFLFSLLLGCLAFSSPSLYAKNAENTENKAVDEDQQAISDLLAQKTPPDGVVFELIGSADSNYLPNALEKIKTYKKQLQAKFPKLEIVVVSHGAEQFELMTENVDKENKTHRLVKHLVAEDVPVHICETHASWRGKGVEDFPDYITPSPTGPAQIEQYEELGYTLIVVE